MRDPERIPEVIEALAEAWERHPDWRLGQLIRNAITPTLPRGEAWLLFTREDDEWLRELRKL